MNTEPAAFMSYVRADDERDKGQLTKLCVSLSAEVRAQRGKTFRIFQDRKDIAWGQSWRDRIEKSLDSATFLIAIITPGFFESHACREELERFLKREKALGRNDLILPVYYIECPLLENAGKREADPLARIIASRQRPDCADWRDLRRKAFPSRQVTRALTAMAKQLVDALERNQQGNKDSLLQGDESADAAAENDKTIESLSGQSREITVLFSYIRGFASLSESSQPEKIVSFLQRYFSNQVAVVLRHGGKVDKFRGDSIMAFWGAPLPDPDHAKRAVACALEMEQALQAFRQEPGNNDAGFDIGIGVHTGNAVIGLIGAGQEQEYTAIGDTVNLASRVEGMTKGVARILVTATTAKACKGAYAFTARGAFPIRGRLEQIELFEPAALS